jgi:hypothetical protein
MGKPIYRLTFKLYNQAKSPFESSGVNIGVSILLRFCMALQWILCVNKKLWEELITCVGAAWNARHPAVVLLAYFFHFERHERFMSLPCVSVYRSVCPSICVSLRILWFFYAMHVLSKRVGISSPMFLLRMYSLP